MRSFPALAVLSLALSVSSSAAAQEWRGIPTFATLDRGDGDSLAGVDLGLVLFDGDATGLRVDLHGQVVTPAGLGGYLAVAASRLSGEGDAVTAVGDIELGGLWVTPQDPRYSFVLRAGVALPTASDGVDEVITNALTTVPVRLTDLALAAPDVTWLRLGASPVVRAGLVFLRADVGVDLPVLQEDDGDEAEVLGRLNLGVGVDPGPVAFTAELATLAAITSDDEGDERFLHTVAVGARWIGGPVQPSLAIALPLDEVIRQDIDLAVIGGLQGLF